MTLKLGLSGALGKVGLKFLEFFSQKSYKNIELTLILIKEKNNKYFTIHEQYRKLFDNIKVVMKDEKLLEFKDDFDVILDFSVPQACVDRAFEVSQLGKPFITGTTGLSNSQISELVEYAQTTPIIMAQNFSWGINFIFSILKTYTNIIPYNYFVELYESHGPQKQDAPGGTAKRIIEILKSEKLFKNIFINNFNIPLTPQDLQVFVSRNSLNTNEHRIIIKGPYEELIIQHKSFSREVYIENALKACIYSLSLKPGLYYFENINEYISQIKLEE
ncbi:MAG: dihydrodipicolinate reductase C-terminal domain-containing protein [Planctomycetota bacterium]